MFLFKQRFSNIPLIDFENVTVVISVSYVAGQVQSLLHIP